MNAATFFKYLYQITAVLPAIVGAVREVVYAYRSVFGKRSDLPAVSPLWPAKMDGDEKTGYERPISSRGGFLRLETLVFFGIVAVVLLLALCGCGAASVIPVVHPVSLDVPDSALVVFDGQELGRGPVDLLLLENLPNYLRIYTDSLDLRLIVVSCPGLDSLRVR